jgi:dTDP-4-amino-4,6-dideoxy-D-galactose acyltransferase
MIEYIEWDSKFFGYKIGKLDLCLDSHDFPDFSEFQDYDLVYIFSVNPLKISISLVDTKVIFKKVTSNHSIDKRICTFDSSLHSYEELLNLAYLSGHDSRFLKDRFFGEVAFKNLYKRWIDISIKEVEINVLIYLENKRILGFVTFTNKEPNSSIGLIAVDPIAQGKGIGVKLMHAVESFLGPNKSLIVSTQETNKNACKFYQKLCFKIENKQYIYHYVANPL